MRLVLFLNNWGGWQIARWLRERNETVVGLVLHPENEERFARQIQDALDLPPERIWRAPELRTPETLTSIRALNPDIGISGWFGYVLKPELLRIFSQECINLHAAYLPLNGGWHTNVWPILDGSPAGVTIHVIDEGIDTGDIIVQRAVAVDPTETGGSLHQKLTYEMVDIFKSAWPIIRAGKHTRTPQDRSRATKHRKAELAGLDCIQLNKQYPGRELLNLLRARTYPPYPSAYFIANAQRVYVRVRFFESKFSEQTELRPTLIDLDRLYTAGEFLEILRGPGDPAQPSAYFVHEGRRIFLSSQQLDQQQIDPGGNPMWITTEKVEP
jgi:methionyl-tRNA formyltransferase